ncbi:DUF6215 domain-containing protein [Streptomyces sp. NPDC048659]|uniref:DUF6215 domain-containing protein n=1 Tax=Streptomyces sp. NPDC048659 TaxID=3155489 RepID=UPI003417A02E
MTEGTEGTDGALSRSNVAGQAIAALALGGVLAGGFWYMAKADAEEAQARGPAVCTPSHPATPEGSPEPRRTRPAGYVPGDALCRALNRPDLPRLLGTPGEEAQNAWGSDGWIGSDARTGIAAPEGDVRFPTYAAKLSVSYDRLPVATMGRLLGKTAEPTRVLGRQAVLYSDRTLALKIPLAGGSEAESAPGGIARHLLVAKDAKDGGGSYELVIWRQDEAAPDDAALLRIAERVLPTLPGWAAR